MKTFPVIKRLPTSYYTHIGRVVSRWAYLEWKLRRIVYALLQVGPKHGRINPKAMKVTIADFKNWTVVIENAVAGLEMLESEIDEQRRSSLKA